MAKKFKKQKKAKEICSVLLWHKAYIKRIRQRFGLSKYQMLWITFGKGVVVGYVLAFMVHRWMDSTQKLIEKFVEWSTQSMGESQVEAIASVMAAFVKLKKNEV